MNLILMMNGDCCLRLTFTLLHFLWQGAAIALLALAASVLLRRSAAAARYWVFVVALAAMAFCPPATFLAVSRSGGASSSIQASAPVTNPNLGSRMDVEPLPPDPASPSRPAQPAAVVPEAVAPAAPQPPQFGLTPVRTSEPSLAGRLLSAFSSEGFRRAAPWVAACYFAGVLLMIARLLLSLSSGRSLRGQSRPVEDPALLALLQRAARAMRLRAVPAAAWCRQVAVPTVVGVLKPAILLPLSLASGLSSEQIEMLLLHELAHLRRYDPWVNLVQWVIETALFFHPAVWWVSSRVRAERELACDDAVLAAGIEKTQYADLLLRMAEISRRAVALQRVFALTIGSHGPRPSGFMRRVMRLIEGRDGFESIRLRRVWPLGVILLALLFGGSWVAFRTNAADQQPQPSSITPSIKTLSTTAKTEAADAAKDMETTSPTLAAKPVPPLCRECTGEFQFDKDIPVKMVVGPPGAPRMLRLAWIRFHATEKHFFGDLRIVETTETNSLWQLQVEVLDAKGALLAQAKGTDRTTMMLFGAAGAEINEHDLRFDFGDRSWLPANVSGGPALLAAASKFRLSIEQVAKDFAGEGVPPPPATNTYDHRDISGSRESAPPKGNLAFDVRVPEKPGYPGKAFYLTAWRAEGPNEPPHPPSAMHGDWPWRVCWRDTATGTTWWWYDSYGGGDHQIEGYPPGKYRFTVANHRNEPGDPTPVGVSEPLVLDAKNSPLRVTIEPGGDCALTIRSRLADSSSNADELIPVVLFDPSGVPIGDLSSGVPRFLEQKTHEARYSHLKPGRYTLEVGHKGWWYGFYYPESNQVRRSVEVVAGKENVVEVVYPGAQSMDDKQPQTAQQNLDAALELNEPTYDIGEPIIASLAIKNMSGRTISFDRGSDGRSGRAERFRFRVTDDKGKAVPDPLKIFVSHNMAGGLGGGVDLAPGETYTVTALLNLYASPRAPGRYTVSGDYQLTQSMDDTTSGRLTLPPVAFSVRNGSSRMSQEEGRALFSKYKLDGIHPCILYGLQNSTRRIPQLIAMMEPKTPTPREDPFAPLAERNASFDAMESLVLMPDKAAVYRALEKEIAARWPNSNSKYDYLFHPLGHIYRTAVTPESLPVIEPSLDHANAAVADLAFLTALSMGSAKALDRLPAALRSSDSSKRQLARENAFQYLNRGLGSPGYAIEGIPTEFVSKYGDALMEGFRQEEGDPARADAKDFPDILPFGYLLEFHFAHYRLWDAIGIAVESNSPLKHTAALRYLAMCGNNAVFPPLEKDEIARLIPFARRQMQTHPDARARALAMRCLGLWGDTESIPALTQALDAPDKPLRLAAAEALILLHHDPLLEKCIERLVEEDEARDPKHVIWVAQRLGMKNAEQSLRLELPGGVAATLPIPNNAKDSASEESTARSIREMREQRKAALRRLSGGAPTGAKPQTTSVGPEDIPLDVQRRMERLASPDPKERAKAAEELGKMGGAPAGFGPERELSVGTKDALSNTFVDFETGRLLTPPPGVRTELERNRRFWESDAFDAAKDWPQTFRWICEQGIDAAAHYFDGSLVSRERDRSLFKILFVMSQNLEVPENPAITERLWDNPDFLLRRLREHERSLIQRGESDDTLRAIGSESEGESSHPFKTSDGTYGILRLQSPPKGSRQPFRIRYKLLRNVSAAAPDGISGSPEIWCTLLPEVEVFRPSDQFRHAEKWFIRPPTRVDFPALHLEIRSADARVAIHHMPVNPRGGQYSFGAQAWHKGDPNYSLQSLAAGEYLVAATRNGARCSNVARFRVDPQFEPSDVAILELAPLPKEPWTGFFPVGLRAIGPEPADPELTNMRVAYPTLIINGVERSSRMMAWRGLAPLQPGQHMASIVDIANYVPPIDPGREHIAIAKVGQHLSAPVTIPAAGALERLWDAATAKSAAESLPAALKTLGAVAVAMDAHRIDSNAYPKTLYQLTTPVAYLSALPEDPFATSDTQKLLHWKPDAKPAPLLYSVGPDRMDQGGAIVYDPTNGATSPGDIVRALKPGEAKSYEEIHGAALGKEIQQDAPIEDLIKALESDNINQWSRATTFLAMRKAESKPAVPALIKALDRPQVRGSAMYALQGIGPAAAEAIPAMITLLEDQPEDQGSGGGPAQTLVSIGPAAVPALKEAARPVANPGDREIARRLWSSAALVMLGETDAAYLRYLSAAMQSKSRWISYKGLQAVQMVGPKAAPLTPELKRMMTEPQFQQRESIKREIITALVRIGPAASEALPKVISALGAKDPLTRIEAIRAVRAIGGAKAQAAIPQLIQALQANDKSDAFVSQQQPRVRAEAAETLRAIGPAAREAILHLISLLKDENEEVRFNAAHAIGEIDPKNPEAVEALIAAMSDSDDRVQNFAADALFKSGVVNQKVVQAFVRAALNRAQDLEYLGGLHSIPDIRGAIRDFFQMLGPEDRVAIPELLVMAKDNHEGIQRISIEALANIGEVPADLIPTLIARALENEGYWAAGVLRKMGPKAAPAAPAMLKILQTENDPRRTTALYVLVAIGRPTADPAIPLIERALKKYPIPPVYLCEALLSLDPGSQAALDGLEKYIANPPKGSIYDIPQAHALLLKHGRNAPEHLESLLKTLNGGDSRLSPLAAKWIMENSQDARTRRQALDRIFAIQDEPAMDDWAKTVASEGLRQIDPGETDALPRLIGLIRGIKDPAAQWQRLSAAVAGLGRFGPAAREALPDLNALIQSKNWRVRDAAREAIKAIGPASSTPSGNP